MCVCAVLGLFFSTVRLVVFRFVFGRRFFFSAALSLELALFFAFVVLCEVRVPVRSFTHSYEEVR